MFHCLVQAMAAAAVCMDGDCRSDESDSWCWVSAGSHAIERSWLLASIGERRMEGVLSLRHSTSRLVYTPISRLRAIRRWSL